MQIWFYDGSVRCFSGWHILLAVIALLSLLFLTLLIPLVAAALQFDFLRERVRHKLTRRSSSCFQVEIHMLLPLLS